MTRFYLLISLLSLSSCDVYIQYIGSSYTPTKKVDFYVDRSAIKKPYTIIGKAYVSSEFNLEPREEYLQTALEKKALEKGADAILFEEYYLTESGYSIETVTQRDSINKGIRTTRTTTSTPVNNVRRDIFFLKYD